MLINRGGRYLDIVIPVLGTGIHALATALKEGVDARTKFGHDGFERPMMGAGKS
jgi:hypothetical protein